MIDRLRLFLDKTGCDIPITSAFATLFNKDAEYYEAEDKSKLQKAIDRFLVQRGCIFARYLNLRIIFSIEL